MIERLTCRFGRTLALDGLSVTVQRGEVFGILGHNGAGKTTAVRALNGVVQPEHGVMRVLGLDPRRDGERLRARTAVLTESASVDERLTARETLHVFADLYDVATTEVRQRTARLLGTFGLAERADERVSAYSKGMRQRLALARALVHEPELIFLDEPTAGLDPAATRLLHELIRTWSCREGRTIVLCTHDLHEAQTLCDRVAVLAHGRLLACGTPRELIAVTGERALRIEVPSEHLDVAMRIAATMMEDASVDVAGSSSLVVRGVSGDTAPRLAAALVSQAVPLLALVPVDPSLADVYFALQPDTAPRLDLEGRA